MFLSHILKGGSAPHEFDRLVVSAGSARHPCCHHLALNLNLFSPVALPGCDQGIMEARGLTSIVRASVHYYNSEAEIDRFCTALAMLR